MGKKSFFVGSSWTFFPGYIKNIDTHHERFISIKQVIKKISPKSLWQTYMKWTVEVFMSFYCCYFAGLILRLCFYFMLAAMILVYTNALMVLATFFLKMYRREVFMSFLGISCGVLYPVAGELLLLSHTRISRILRSSKRLSDKKYILIAFCNHNLACFFLQVQITRSAN